MIIDRNVCRFDLFWKILCATSFFEHLKQLCLINSKKIYFKTSRTVKYFLKCPEISKNTIGTTLCWIFEILSSIINYNWLLNKFKIHICIYSFSAIDSTSLIRKLIPSIHLGFNWTFSRKYHLDMISCKNLFDIINKSTRGNYKQLLFTTNYVRQVANN